MPLDLYFFTIDLTGPDYVKTFLTTYSRYTSTIILILLAYHIILFRYHINPRTFNLFWKNERPVAVSKMTKPQVWSLCIALFGVIAAAMRYSSEGWLALYAGALHLDASYPYLLFSMIVSAAVIALFNFGLLMIAFVFWRYSGNHSPDPL
jgi:hypothetical protein